MNIYTTETMPPLGKESFETLYTRPGVVIEKICSNRLENGQWYDQEGDEWVVLLQGSALLEFEAGKICEMAAGDCRFIPARTRHRVAETSEDALWLAVHFERTD